MGILFEVHFPYLDNLGVSNIAVCVVYLDWFYKMRYYCLRYPMYNTS